MVLEEKVEKLEDGCIQRAVVGACDALGQMIGLAPWEGRTVCQGVAGHSDKGHRVYNGRHGHGSSRQAGVSSLHANPVHNVTRAHGPIQVHARVMASLVVDHPMAGHICSMHSTA